MSAFTTLQFIYPPDATLTEGRHLLVREPAGYGEARAELTFETTEAAIQWLDNARALIVAAKEAA